VAYLLDRSAFSGKVFLVRPAQHSPYGFGGLSEQECFQCYEDKLELQDLDALAGLWTAYSRQAGDLRDRARHLEKSYPFLLPAVDAHLAREGDGNNPGRPKASLIRIMEELGTKDFAPVFRAFCQQESIYGFGDLPVKRILDEILSDGSKKECKKQPQATTILLEKPMSVYYRYFCYLNIITECCHRLCKK
jgi:hypothetical protein